MDLKWENSIFVEKLIPFIKCKTYPLKDLACGLRLPGDRWNILHSISDGVSFPWKNQTQQSSALRFSLLYRKNQALAAHCQLCQITNSVGLENWNEFNLKNHGLSMHALMKT